VALHLYDTRSRRIRLFEPLTPGCVGVYLCGPTVQSTPHIGHLRSAVAFDVLRRWLLASGSTVTWVRNVTDIDDKIIVNAVAENTTPWELAERNTRAFTAAYDAVGVLPPTVQPRATGHIPEIVEMMQTLVDGGYAYQSEGSVWFSVAAYPEYGSLSGQRPDAMQESAETESGKRDPRDFALWKAVKPGEPFWSTPYGPGRPGWHLECSAMADKYLGTPFDIHAAGLDLVFPHNENEQAQSACASGCGRMAGYWLHNGLVTTGGEKMSKSIGNVFGLDEALALVRPQALRYALACVHYRSPMEYGEKVLVESAAAYERIETFVRNAEDRLGSSPELGPDGLDEPMAAVWVDFAAALDDDLATSRAVAAIFAAVSQGNLELSASPAARDDAALAGWLSVTRRMLVVLGLDPVSQWPASAGGDLAPVLDTLVALREQARAARDFATADALRDAFGKAGISVEDTADGPRWRVG
jgi:cysteinyl-tRNA synthetase